VVDHDFVLVNTVFHVNYRLRVRVEIEIRDGTQGEGISLRKRWEDMLEEDWMVDCLGQGDLSVKIEKCIDEVLVRIIEREVEMIGGREEDEKEGDLVGP
jgi:hypothetical protein